MKIHSIVINDPLKIVLKQVWQYCNTVEIISWCDFFNEWTQVEDRCTPVVQGREFGTENWTVMVAFEKRMKSQ